MGRRQDDRHALSESLPAIVARYFDHGELTIRTYRCLSNLAKVK
jgi:hypothetical protein